MSIGFLHTRRLPSKLAPEIRNLPSVLALAGRFTQSILRTGMSALKYFIILVCTASIFSGEDRTPARAPRGKPIRPPAEISDVNTQNIVRLPGGVVITNVPGEFLPRTTNIIRLPTVAARKYEKQGFQATSFTELARFFVTAPTNGIADWEAVRRQIPEDVLTMNGRKVALAGFTLPLRIENGRATEFLLLRSQAACCFGMVPRVNELVMVKMNAPGMKPILDTPVVAAGMLSVKWIGGGDQLTAIYEMQAEKVERAE